MGEILKYNDLGLWVDLGVMKYLKRLVEMTLRDSDIHGGLKVRRLRRSRLCIGIMVN